MVERSGRVSSLPGVCIEAHDDGAAGRGGHRRGWSTLLPVMTTVEGDWAGCAPSLTQSTVAVRYRR